MGGYILGVETSCDETAAAVLDGTGAIRANVIAGQQVAHERHGGVVPEIAARAHLALIDGVIGDALGEAGIGVADVDAIAATCGPGLIGGVLVGASTAKAMALARGVDFYAINHLEGHALTARLTNPAIGFPYLLLLVSGGHTQLLAVEDVGRYHLLGNTLDDAAGEAFDKSAQIMGLGMPGGPAIEAAARQGDGTAFALPLPLANRPGCDFSFSGLKTAVLTAWQKEGASLADGTGRRRIVANLAAALEDAVATSLARQSARGMEIFRRDYGAAEPYFIAAGGVAANGAVRTALEAAAAAGGFRFYAPPPALCTDNAVMIAWAAHERRRAGMAADGLDFAPRPRWPLMEMQISATQSAGAGA